MSEKSMINDLTDGSVSKQLLKFAYPFMLSNLLQTAYTMVDMIVIGQFVGNTGLSAVSIGGDLVLFFTWLGMGLTNAGQVMISQFVGKKDKDSIRRTVGTIFTSVFILAVFLTIVNLSLSNVYLKLMNTPAEALKQAKEYIIVCFSGMIFIYGYNSVSSILRGMGDSKRPFVFVAVASLLNLVLDLLFVAVFKMDSMGAALATIIGQGVSFICSLVYLYIKRESFGFDFKPASFKIDKKLLSSMVKLGIPMALQSVAISVSAMFVNASINGYGLVASAVTGVGNKLSHITSIITNAMYMASSSMIGQNLGAGKVDRVKQIVRTNLTICVCTAVVVSALCELFSVQLFSIFNSDPEILAWAPTYAHVLVVSFLAGSFMSPFNAVISGMGYASLHLFIGLMDGVVARIGLAILLGSVMGYGITGYWFGSALAGFVTAILAGIYYFSGRWKTRKLIVDK